MKRLRYNIGVRLLRFNFVRQALINRADLSEFNQRPSWRIIVGVFLICFSFLMCWPAIGTLGGVAVYFRQPLIALIGGPFLYGSSHLVFWAGMALAGTKHAQVLGRWATRRLVERMISFGDPAPLLAIRADENPQS